MADINEEAMRYSNNNPYSFTRVRLPDNQYEVKYHFQITKQPDPMIAIMLGDFIHNLRSALDYIVVACVPKKHRGDASFPFVYQDIFAKDENGEFVVKDAKRREYFETATKGLNPDARAFIISLQPYQGMKIGAPVSNISLGILSRLGNADKHRQRAILDCGGKGCICNITLRDFPELVKSFPSDRADQILEHNTQYNFPLTDFKGIQRQNGSFIQPSDIEMHLSTTVKITVKAASIGGNAPPISLLLENLMDEAVYDVGEILTKMEFFVIS